MAAALEGIEEGSVGRIRFDARWDFWDEPRGGAFALVAAVLGRSGPGPAPDWAKLVPRCGWRD